MQLKKGNRFLGKSKALNITTPAVYERAEISKYAQEIKNMENMYKQIKHKEEEEKAAIY